MAWKTERSIHYYDCKKLSSQILLFIMKEKWHVPSSIVSKRTVNPIREVVQNMKATPNPDKEFISLALGILIE
jgi:hypothetical protein